MMTRLKLFITMIFSVSFLAFSAAPTASAFTFFGDVCQGNADATVCEDRANTGNPIYGPNGIISTVINILSIIIGVAAVIVIVIAGIQYMLSTGDPTKVNNSKNAILYAVAGLFIAGIAQVLVRFIISKLG